MPSMVKAERVRSRISACQPWITSSFRKMVEVTLGRRARSGVTFGDAGSNEPRPEIVELSVVCAGTVLISAPSCSPLLDMNIARTRVHAKQLTSSAHLSVDRLMRFPDAPLHGHLDRGSDVNRTGTGRNVGIEGSVRRQAQAHVARPGARIPCSALLAFGSDFAAAGFSMEAALHAARVYVPRTRMQVNISWAGLFDFDITAASPAPHRSGNLPRPHVT